jgi:glyoxylase-like metal-dependent hydrolase (beta-lactamase superfamily II)
VTRIKVGSMEILAIQDLGVAFPPGGIFPSVPAEAWAPYRPVYPSAFDGDNLNLNIGSFVISGAGQTILVDTGLGPKTNPEMPGQLVANLKAEGISVDDIGTVIFTHLHLDHVGWNFQDGKATFPRARYVVQQVEWDFFSTQSEDAVMQAQVVPLQATGALNLVSG